MQPRFAEGQIFYPIVTLLPSNSHFVVYVIAGIFFYFAFCHGSCSLVPIQLLDFSSLGEKRVVEKGIEGISPVVNFEDIHLESFPLNPRWGLLLGDKRQ